jgi:hypothetical protein
MKKILLAISFIVFVSSISFAQVRAQTGVWNADKTISGYTLATGGEMERYQTIQITFPKPFNTKPEIQFSVTRYDGEGGVGARYDCKIISSYKGGFTLEIKTWGGTKIHLIGGTWMAIGE